MEALQEKKYQIQKYTQTHTYTAYVQTNSDTKITNVQYMLTKIQHGEIRQVYVYVPIGVHPNYEFCLT